MKEKIKNQKNSKKMLKALEQPLESMDADIDETMSEGDFLARDKNMDNDRKNSAGKDIVDPEKSGSDSDFPPSLLTADLQAETQRRQQRSNAFFGVAAVGLIAGLVGGIVGGVYLGPWVQNSFNNKSGGQELRKVTLDENSALIDVVKEVNPAVVSIIVSKDLPKIQQYFFDPFGGSDFFSPFTPSAGNNSGGTVKTQVAAGSGFIVTSDGMIMTNKHVVEDDKADYTVITKDGKKYNGKVVAKDPLNDLAVVKIDAKDLLTVQFGDSNNLQLGQRVIAIGNALGELNNTVTTGVVSGIGRSVTAGDTTGGTESLQHVIQTDAAINPGNSGGPLLNLAGQVIGVNTAIDQSGQLVGFAIPSNEAKKVLDDVKQFGKVMRPFLGVRYVLLTADTAPTYKLTLDYGALIIKGTANEPAIVAGSPAEKAGLKEGDVILEVNGKKVDENNSLSDLLRNYKPGDQAVLKIQRGAETKEILVTLGQA